MGIIGLGLPVATVSGDAVLQLAFGVFAVVLGVLYWLAIEGRPAGNAKWFVGGGMGLGIRESDPDLKATFDTAIQSMKDDGSLNALITKWLPGSALF